MDCLRQRLQNKGKSVFLFAAACFLFFCICVRAEEQISARVTGDNVNVRVRPDANSEIIAQLSLDEEVIVLEKGGEWTKIEAPDSSKCWINSVYIENGVIKGDSTNIRCGPGTAFPVVAKLRKGAFVKTIETAGEWTRIKPPVEFGVWVSSKYLKYKEEEKPVEEKSALPPQPQIIESPKVISVPEEEIAKVKLVTYAGKLEDLGVLINRPGTYKIVSEENNNKWICIIKSPTLDINPYINRVVRIEGVVLSQISSWKAPVVELKRLNLIK